MRAQHSAAPASILSLASGSPGSDRQLAMAQSALVGSPDSRARSREIHPCARTACAAWAASSSSGCWAVPETGPSARPTVWRARDRYSAAQHSGSGSGLPRKSRKACGADLAQLAAASLEDDERPHPSPPQRTVLTSRLGEARRVEALAGGRECAERGAVVPVLDGRRRLPPRQDGRFADQRDERATARSRRAARSRRCRACGSGARVARSRARAPQAARSGRRTPGRRAPPGRPGP
jgi:hypothetical protein